MKAVSTISIAGLFILAFSIAGFAAEKKKKKAPVPPSIDTEAVALIKPYDKDSNYEISKDELKAMQADYKSNPTGPLKVFDLSHTGILDDLDRISMNNKLGAAKMVEKSGAGKAK
jgi:hypothetical protein